MQTFSALLALCERKPRVTVLSLTKAREARSFDVFFDLRLNKRWVNNQDTGDLMRHWAHYYVTVMSFDLLTDPGIPIRKSVYYHKSNLNLTQKRYHHLIISVSPYDAYLRQ